MKAVAQRMWTPPATALPTAEVLSGVAFGNGIFVVVGETGTVLTSPDGAAWTQQTTGLEEAEIALQAVAFGGVTFVAVGEGGTIITSTDGVNWTERASGVDGRFLSGVVYGDGVFVACGGGGKVTRSVDGGVTWSGGDSGATFRFLEDLACGNGVLVATAGKGAVIYSHDGGQTWSLTFLPGVVDTFFGLTHGEGFFVLMGTNGYLSTSPDGKTWTGQLSGTLEWLFGGTYHDGTYLVFGAAGTILASTDLETWTGETSGTSEILNGAAAGGGTFVIAGGGADDVGNEILTAEAPAGFSFAQWRQIQFSAAEQLDPLVSGPGADPDLDSLNNFKEYALGLRAKTGDSGWSGLPRLVSVAGMGGARHAAMRYRRAGNRDQLSFQIMKSDTMAAESWVPLGAAETVESNDGKMETILVVDPLSIAAAGARFYELRCTGN